MPPTNSAYGKAEYHRPDGCLHGKEAARFFLVESAAVKIASGVTDMNGMVAGRHFMKNVTGHMAMRAPGLGKRAGEGWQLKSA